MPNENTDNMIGEWRLPQPIADQYSVPDPEKALSGFAALTVIIGANNSGKSRLLRGLFSDRKAEVSPQHEHFQALRRSVSDLRELIRIESHLTKVNDFMHGHLEYVTPPFYHLGDPEPIGRSNKLTAALRQLNGLIERLGSDAFDPLPSELKDKVRHIAAQIRDRRTAAERTQWSPNFHRVYIPPLRGLRPFAEHNAEIVDYYAKRTTKDHFTGNTFGQQFELVTGLGLFQAVRSHRLGKLAQRQLIDEYESYLSERFFERQAVELIPSEGDNVLHVKIGQQVEYPLYNLGDGLQQIIIQTFPLFQHRDKNLLLFIEEPEMHMHAGMQRMLIEALLETNQTASRQVIVTTHSQQFLDLTLDHDRIAIFRATKTIAAGEGSERLARCDVSLVSNVDLEVLRELGVHNSSVLLVNSTIWVEGITDRMYLRRYLQLHQDNLGENEPRFAEDIHFAFVEYSGSNLAHWSFLEDPPRAIKVERLCAEVFLVADRDKGKNERHMRIAERLRDRYFVLPCREVENLLSPRVLGTIVAQYEGTTTSIEDCDWKDYADQQLGEFIDKRLGASRKRQTTYSDKGTIREKVRFAEKAIVAIRTLDDLTPAAKTLAERMYAFIKVRNPKTFAKST